MSAIDQKRIAKNTLLLYVRLGLVVLVSLYTSRVVLDALGDVDFGIYNAVGGVVLMFSFLSNTMATAWRLPGALMRQWLYFNVACFHSYLQ